MDKCQYCQGYHAEHFICDEYIEAVRTVDDYTKKLSTYVELISDDFQSTFSVVDENTLANMMGFEHDFESLIKIIHKYIPDCEVKFTKTNQFDDKYDIYLVTAVC